MAEKQPEVWMRGPVPDVPPLLQPVAHALLQAMEEVRELAAALPDEQLWVRPAGMASAGFHLQHMTGVLDRMTSYAQALPLTEQQFAYLHSEAHAPHDGCTATELAEAFCLRATLFIASLQHIPDDHLLLPRGVGRQQLPSTVLGLLFHAAEHTMRHLGQLVVTVAVVKKGEY